MVPQSMSSPQKNAHRIKLFKEHFVNIHDYNKSMIKFRFKFQFQIPLQFYRAAEKAIKIKLVMVIVKCFDKYHNLFSEKDIMQE